MGWRRTADLPPVTETLYIPYMASLANASGARTTQFLLTLDRSEKERWRAAADQAGISIAEYVRRAVQRAEEFPSDAEVSEATRLARDVQAAVGRMETRLDGALAKVAELLDDEREARRREEIFGELQRSGAQLDLAALARAR